MGGGGRSRDDVDTMTYGSHRQPIWWNYNRTYIRLDVTSAQAAYHIKDHQPPAVWPQDGVVEFKSYSTRYRSELDLVLREVSCKIKSGEKVGSDKNRPHHSVVTFLLDLCFQFYTCICPITLLITVF